MRDQGLQKVPRDRKKTVIPDPAQPCPEGQADAPDKLRFADSSYVQTALEMAYATFGINVFPQIIIGWRASTLMTVRFVLDAPNRPSAA